jgi:hypothetical protein
LGQFLARPNQLGWPVRLRGPIPKQGSAHGAAGDGRPADSGHVGGEVGGGQMLEVTGDAMS